MPWNIILVCPIH